MYFQEYLLLTFPDLQLNCRIYMILMLLFFLTMSKQWFCIICRNYLLHWFYKKISKIFDQIHKLRTIHKRQSTLPPHPCRQFFTPIHRQFFTTFFLPPRLLSIADFLCPLSTLAFSVRYDKIFRWCQEARILTDMIAIVIPNHGLRTHKGWIPNFFVAQIQIPIPNKYLGCEYKSLVFFRNNDWIMEKMDKGLTVPKWVLNSSAENSPNAPKLICPICLPKFKSLGFQRKKGIIGRS